MSVSILIPYYNRYKFKELIEYNINSQDYNNIKEVIVMDDSDEEEVLTLKCNYPVKIYRIFRTSIGQKRNKLIKHCSSKYGVFMDTDDFYLPNYISHSIELLKNNKGAEVVGSADMLFYFSKTNNFSSMCCLKMHLIHEATLCCNAKWFKNNIKFLNSNSGEGQGLKGFEKFIVESDINECMVCLCHSGNTINKDGWNKGENEVLEKLIKPKIINHLNIISRINL